MQSYGTDEFDKKKTLIAMLAKMANSDSFQEIEWEFIRNVGHSFGLENSTVDEIIQQANSTELVVPSSSPERLTFFFHLIALMKVDGHIDPREKDMAKKLGFELGLRPSMTEEIIGLAEEHPETVLPDSEVKSILSKYFN